MLPSELIQKIKRIHIRSRRTVDSVMAGHYRSVFRGSGMEFEEVREYSPGDEIKSIDWKVSARMGRPYVKCFREERELIVMLLVDMSASTLFGTTGMQKRESITEMASVLAFNAIRNNDKVGLILFTDQVEKYIPPKKGSSHVWRVIKEILSFEPQSAGTDVATAARFLSKVGKRKSTAFFISDFQTNGFMQDLKNTARRHDCINILVKDPKEFELPAAGLLLAKDLETGQLAYLDCSDKKQRRQYQQLKKQKHTKPLEQMKSAGIDSIEFCTDQNPGDALNLFFRLREKRRRQ